MLSLKAWAFEIKDFNSSILTSSEEPLVLLLETHCNTISCKTIKCKFIISLSQIIYLHKPTSARTKISSIRGKNELVNCQGFMGCSKLFWIEALATFNIPKFYLFIIPCCSKNNAHLIVWVLPLILLHCVLINLFYNNSIIINIKNRVKNNKSKI